LTEQFGIVRTNLCFASLGKPLRSILVTSPTPGDGKTTTAINLAAALALSGKRVMLVDADFRHPTVHTHLGIDNKHGLSICLLEDNLGGMYDVPCVAVPAVPNLYVLPAGPLPPNPTELLGSDRMLRFKRSVLADGKQRRSVVDMVVFDSPPVLPVADALVLAGQVDGTILVVDAAHARVGEVLRARDNLQRASRASNGLHGVMLISAGRNEERYPYPSSNVEHEIAVAQRDESIDNPDVLVSDTAAHIRQ
jgi:capsular exopolysaccharide synthesis family protein